MGAIFGKPKKNTPTPVVQVIWNRRLKPEWKFESPLGISIIRQIFQIMDVSKRINTSQFVSVLYTFSIVYTRIKYFNCTCYRNKWIMIHQERWYGQTMCGQTMEIIHARTWTSIQSPDTWNRWISTEWSTGPLPGFLPYMAPQLASQGPLQLSPQLPSSNPKSKRMTISENFFFQSINF